MRQVASTLPQRVAPVPLREATQVPHQLQQVKTIQLSLAP
jgi:hypothetical protein